MERMVYLSEDDKVDADELAFIMSPRSDDSAWLPADMTVEATGPGGKAAGAAHVSVFDKPVPAPTATPFSPASAAAA